MSGQLDLLNREVRLECSICDTPDGDGIGLEDAKSAGWTEIESSADEDGDLLGWATHSGVCPHPECKKAWVGELP